MTLRSKSLSSAFLAIALLSAVAASSAFAAEGTITPGEPGSLKGTVVGANQWIFGNGARVVECSTASLSGSLAAAATAVSLRPVNTACKAKPGGGEAFVVAAPCTYRFTAATKLTASTGEGSLAIEGCEKESILVTAWSPGGALLCSYAIAEQGPLGKVSWTNLNSPVKQVELDFDVSGLVANVSIGTALTCGAGAGKATTLTLKGVSTVAAESGAAPTSLAIS
jgi:hypothetical protein